MNKKTRKQKEELVTLFQAIQTNKTIESFHNLVFSLINPFGFPEFSEEVKDMAFKNRWYYERKKDKERHKREQERKEAEKEIDPIEKEREGLWHRIFTMVCDLPIENVRTVKGIFDNLCKADSEQLSSIYWFSKGLLEDKKGDCA